MAGSLVITTQLWLAVIIQCTMPNYTFYQKMSETCQFLGIFQVAKLNMYMANI